MESIVFWYMICCFINWVVVAVRMRDIVDNTKEAFSFESFFYFIIVASGFLGTGVFFLIWVLTEPPPVKGHNNHYPYYKAPKPKPPKPVLEEIGYCSKCKKFDEYIKNNGRNPNNCSSWLCNEGVCPHEEVITKEEREKADKRSKRLDILNQCECNGHLGMGKNIKCPVHGENVEKLFGPKKKKFWI